MRRILVTGGMGFIGSHFLHYLQRHCMDDQVINLDLLTYAGNRQNAAQFVNTPNYRFVLGDIADEPLVERVMSAGIDIVVHFAAETHVDRSIRQPHRFVRTNVVGTHVLLAAAKKYRVQKFVHISTDEVYGTLGPTGRFTEETPLAPNSPYSASKAGSDLLARAYHETYGMDVSITRCSNNFGPRQFLEKFIPLGIACALNDQPIPIYGDGQQVRDWLYVEDHCRAIDLVMCAGRAGEIYNIGGGNEYTNVQVANIILEELDKPSTLLRFVADRPGHDRRYAIDSSKIRAELGWQPEFSFRAALRQTIHWYAERLHNPQGGGAV